MYYIDTYISIDTSTSSTCQKWANTYLLLKYHTLPYADKLDVMIL